jgi:hypothetical protein
MDGTAYDCTRRPLTWRFWAATATKQETPGIAIWQVTAQEQSCFSPGHAARPRYIGPVCAKMLGNFRVNRPDERLDEHPPQGRGEGCVGKLPCNQ